MVVMALIAEDHGACTILDYANAKPDIGLPVAVIPRDKNIWTGYKAETVVDVAVAFIL